MGKSRHSRFLFATVARDFICASADGMGHAVAVTYRELIIATSRMFERPILRRIPLAEVESFDVRYHRGVGRLLLDVRGRQPESLSVLYRGAASADFEQLAVTLAKVSRRRRRPMRDLRRRAIERVLARRSESRTAEARIAAAR